MSYLFIGHLVLIFNQILLIGGYFNQKPLHFNWLGLSSRNKKWIKMNRIFFLNRFEFGAYATLNTLNSKFSLKLWVVQAIDFFKKSHVGSKITSHGRDLHEH